MSCNISIIELDEGGTAQHPDRPGAEKPKISVFSPLSVSMMKKNSYMVFATTVDRDVEMESVSTD